MRTILCLVPVLAMLGCTASDPDAAAFSAKDRAVRVKLDPNRPRQAMSQIVIARRAQLLAARR